MIGQQFGRLTVIEAAAPHVEPRGRHHRMWLCRCACGTEKEIYHQSLVRGLTRSCGCLRRETTVARTQTHGHSKKGNWSATYRSWSGMITRCTSEGHDKFSYYGGRGITVCDRWSSSFENFLADMGECPPAHSIDRVDVNGNYEPGNCRWATRTEQLRNKRNNVLVEYAGRKMTLVEASELSGINYSKLQARIARGWSLERALRS